MSETPTSLFLDPEGNAYRMTDDPSVVRHLYTGGLRAILPAGQLADGRRMVVFPFREEWGASPGAVEYDPNGTRLPLPPEPKIPGAMRLAWGKDPVWRLALAELDRRAEAVMREYRKSLGYAE